MAQGLYRRGDYAAAADAYLKAAEGSTQDAAGNFKFNAAVSLFKAGEFKAAKEILSALSRDAKDADIEQIERTLGLAAYNAAQALKAVQPEDLATRTELLHEASEAFRRASRSSSHDEIARNNLSIALDEYRTVESDAHIAALMEKYQTQNPGQLAAEMLSNQRRIMTELAAASTNLSPTRIAEFESVAAQQKANADLWIPLKGKIMQAAAKPDMSDEQQKQMAQLNHQIEATRQDMLDASEQLGDLKAESDQLTQTSEVAVYQLWKSIAPHDLILQEEIRQQSNAM